MSADDLTTVGLHMPGPARPHSAVEALLLLDWKRRVSALYHDVRSSADPRAAWDAWRAGRDELYTTHDRSPIALANRAGFRGLSYFDYDPDARVLAEIYDADTRTHDVEMSGGGSFTLTQIGTAVFDMGGGTQRLELLWIGGFRGGLFVPFRDATTGHSTYGGGRYLLDTLKGQDLGTDGGRLILDFNFAYHPPCFYNPDWSCPLPPPANTLGSAIGAGERID